MAQSSSTQSAQDANSGLETVHSQQETRPPYKCVIKNPKIVLFQVSLPDGFFLLDADVCKSKQNEEIRAFSSYFKNISEKVVTIQDCEKKSDIVERMIEEKKALEEDNFDALIIGVVAFVNKENKVLIGKNWELLNLDSFVEVFRDHSLRKPRFFIFDLICDAVKDPSTKPQGSCLKDHLNMANNFVYYSKTSVKWKGLWIAKALLSTYGAMLDDVNTIFTRVTALVTDHVHNEDPPFTCIMSSVTSHLIFQFLNEA